ncbi:penicillin-binding protein 1C [Serratia fonticola]|uniref:Penicillin-binding protein 1C n=1 Tax=Serratia fonticola TaxID=47917 RepID=A0A4U9V4E6_SERFO|nr:penicillin-binding protein 1C [Serratia fonticola]
MNFSRNIPAVYVASQLRQPTFYQFLSLSGIANLASENHYGLSLVLGGGEITAQELAKLYALLANRGALRPLRMQKSDAYPPPIRLISEEASFTTLDMLRQHRRPGDTLAQRSSSLPVYWKTGTSWGFRDAWSVGIFGPYVLVVWEGNFDSRGNNVFVGADAAAPLFFNIIDSINASYPALQEPKHPFPKQLKRVGYLPGQRQPADAVVPAERQNLVLSPASRRSRSIPSIVRWCWILTAVRWPARRMIKHKPVPKCLSSAFRSG